MIPTLLRQCIAIALVCSFIAPVANAKRPPAKIKQDFEHSVVFLEAEVTLASGEVCAPNGTGFLISDQGFVLTTSHLLSNCGDWDSAKIVGSVTSRSAHKWPLEIVSDDSKADLLLLKFPEVGVEWSPVTLGAPTKLEVGEQLFVLGFPLTYDLSLKDGILSSKNGPGGSWQITVPLNKGDSGAPVLDSNGRAVAMVIGGDAAANGVSFCVPLNVANSELTIAGVSLGVPIDSLRPRPTLAPGSWILLEEFFEDNENGWHEFFVDEDAQGKIEEESYFLSSRRQGELRLVAISVIFDQQREFSIECDLKRVSEEEGAFYGLVWGLRDTTEFFFFTINQRGRIAIGRVDQGVFHNDRLTCPSSNTGPAVNEENIQLGIRGSSGRVFFYVNKNLVGSLVSQDFFGSHLGFIVSGRAQVAFDNLVVASE